MLRRSFAMVLVFGGLAAAQILEKSLDLEFLCAPTDRVELSAAALPLHAAFVAQFGEDGVVRTREAVRVFEIQELADLCPLLVPSATGKGSLSVQPMQRALRVRGTPEEHASLERGLTQLVRESERTATVSIERIAPDGSRHIVGKGRFCHGVPARLGAVLSERHCIGVEVEVAQNAAISSPRIARLQMGESFVVTALSWPDGRWLLRIAGGHSEVHHVETRRLGGEHLGRIELPLIRSDLAMTSALFAAGQAMEFAMQSEGERRRYRVTLDAEVEPAVGPATPFAWLPLGPALMARVNSVIEPKGRGTREVSLSPIPWHLPYEPAEVAELLRSAEPARWSRPDHHLQVAGRGLFVRGEEAAVAAVRERWIEALAPFAESYMLAFQVIESEGALNPPESDARALSAQTLSSALGEPFYASGGVERLILRESAVEIAQESEILAPEFGPSFTGIALLGRLSKAPSGGLRLALRGSRSDLMELGSKVQVASDVDSERRADWSFEVNQEIALDRWVALAEGPAPDGGPKRRVLWARISAAAR